MAKIKEIVNQESEDESEVSDEEEIEEGSSEEASSEEEEESSSDEVENEGKNLTIKNELEINQSDDSDDESYEEGEEEKQEKEEEIVEEEEEEDPFIAINNVSNDLEPKRMSRNVAIIDEYQHDSSDEEDIRNTIGNVPISWYDEYPHIGYDWTGNPIERKGVKGNEVDDFMKRVDDPLYWRTVEDNMTGERVLLTDEDASLVQRITKGKYPDPNYNPYPEFVDFFTYEKMIHPLTNEPERKASFIPSLSEKRMVSKLVSKMKRKWQLPKVDRKEKKGGMYSFNYDLWEREMSVSKRQEKRQRKYIPAPKMRLPGHEMSYNPPPEYLLTDLEKDKIRARNEEKDPQDQRPLVFPTKYPNLRSVPAYTHFIRERFERCLDLYLCPRVRKMKANVDPEDLIPKLPKPKELQPFPTILSILFTGHEDTIRSISLDPKGQFLASGSDDKTVRIWEVLTGRCFKKFDFLDEIKCVAWNPNATKSVIAVTFEKTVALIQPEVGDKLVRKETDDVFKALIEEEASDAGVVEWNCIKEHSDGWNRGRRMTLTHKFSVEKVTWHPKGDYFAVVMPKGGNKSVVIHQLSKKRSQVPFKKSKGIISSVLFHPTRPYFCVATKQYVRIYNLLKQELSKKLMTGCNSISSMDIHPGGDNIILGSFDGKLPWFDLDLSSKPYKTMRYHKKAIRSVAYHKKYPLFASSSDDGSVIVAHGMVYRLVDSILIS